LKSSWLRKTFRMYVIYMTIGVLALPLGILFAIWKEHGNIASFLLTMLALVAGCLAGFLFSENRRPQSGIDTAPGVSRPDEQETANTSSVQLWSREQVAGAAFGSRLRIETVHPPAYNAR
jgi:hypothetical protein